ncbi:hypothetical protein D9757_000329 [Collybiopsis confluens]|uniref:BOD1/SHG1 domain-containing protein n=1 Tax=Collybiopsis confluens TaxID=2823264 RepID=A0A8H5I210_9AGAR|nr:hypothetical protein D9757_000329 [Collybiopsis confluens]
MPPPTNPAQLVDEFKKSGEFDRLRRELFAEFQKGDHIPAFNKKTEDVVKQRFASVRARSFMSAKFSQSEGNVRTELMQEIQRFPYVEKTVNDLQIFSDQVFNDDLKNSITRILKEEPNPNANGRPNQLEGKETDSGQNGESSAPEIFENMDEEKVEDRRNPLSLSQATEILVSGTPQRESSSLSALSPQTPNPSSKLSSLSPLDTPSSLSPSLSATSNIPGPIRVPDNASLPRPTAAVVGDDNTHKVPDEKNDQSLNGRAVEGRHSTSDVSMTDAD